MTFTSNDSKTRKKYLVVFNDILVLSEVKKVGKSVFSRDKTIRFGKEQTIGFEHCTIIDLGGNSFKIEGPEGSFYLQTETPQEQKEWVEALQAQIKKYKERPSKV